MIGRKITCGNLVLNRTGLAGAVPRVCRVIIGFRRSSGADDHTRVWCGRKVKQKTRRIYTDVEGVVWNYRQGIIYNYDTLIVGSE